MSIPITLTASCEIDHAKLTYYDPQSTSSLLFRGIDGKECEEFIYMIRLRAMAAGKVRDKEWIADIAGTAFVGDALRWYAELDEDVQEDWLLLRRALLSKYPPPEIRHEYDAQYVFFLAGPAHPW